MNRRALLIASFISISLAKTQSTFAAQLPSLKPTRLGQTIIWRNRKYTSIKSGKKLVWNRGVPLAPSSVKPIPTPSTASTQSAAPRPIFKTVVEIFLCNSDEIKNGETKIFYPKDSPARGKGFVVTRTSKDLKIFDVVCTHSGCSVEMGKVQLTCFCHMSVFNNETGAPESGPAQLALKNYESKEDSGQVLVIDSF